MNGPDFSHVLAVQLLQLWVKAQFLHLTSQCWFQSGRPLTLTFQDTCQRLLDHSFPIVPEEERILLLRPRVGLVLDVVIVMTWVVLNSLT